MRIQVPVISVGYGPSCSLPQEIKFLFRTSHQDIILRFYPQTSSADRTNTFTTVSLQSPGDYDRLLLQFFIIGVIEK